MTTLLIMVVIFGIICWGLSKLVSTFVGVIFIIAAMAFVLKMAKTIFK